MNTTQPPSFKIIPGTNFVVDGFKYASSSARRTFFLSHAHSDHYTGLRADWSHGRIYCSVTTATLVEHMLGVSSKWLQPLPLNMVVMIEGVEVTLVDANHCPGAVQFLFALPDGRKYVHTGDMRYCPAMEENPHLQRFRGADGLFLDTTYCNPRYTFPCQEESIEYVANTIASLMQPGGAVKPEQDRPQLTQHDPHAEQPCHELHQSTACTQTPSRLFVISTYGVGKERILAAVRRQCGVRLLVAERKLGVMQCLDLAGYCAEELFTTNKAETAIHVAQWGFLGDTWPFFRPNFTNMEAYRVEHGVDEVIGFVPTGWMYEMKRQVFSVRRKGSCSVHLVPYSEHSSFQELLDYVKFMRPHKVIPTVGVGGEDAEKCAARMLRHFRSLVDETASKAKFLSAFSPKRPHGDAILKSGGSGDERDNPSDDDVVANDEMKGMEGGQRSEQCEGGCRDCHDDHDGDDVLGQVPQVKDAAGSAGSERAAKRARLATSESPVDRAPQLAQQDDSSNIICLIDESDQEVQPEGQQAMDVQRDGHPASPEGNNAATAAKFAGQVPVDEAGPSSPAALVTGRAAELAALRHLEGVLGAGALSEMRARQLLSAAGNDTQLAINMHFDGWQPAMHSSNPRARGAGNASNSVTGGQTGAPDALDIVAAANKGPSQPTKSPKQGAGGASGSTKRRTARSGAGSSAAVGGAVGGQRSILSFFTAGGSAGPPLAAGDLKVEEAHAELNQEQRPPQSTRASSLCANVREVVNATDTSASAGLPQQPAEVATPTRAAGNDIISIFSSPQSPAIGVVAAAAGSDEAVAPLEAPVTGDKPKPKLVLPMPPIRTSPGKATGSILRGAAAHQAAGSREEQVQRDAVTLPLTQYDPVTHAPWAKGQPAPYLHLARAFEAMDSTTKRLHISDVLVNAFRSVLALSPQDLVAAAYLATGKVAPDYEGLELNVGGSTVVAALQEATGVGRAKLREMYYSLGDIGDVAQACKRTQAMLQRPAALTIQGVLSSLRGLAAEKGQGAAGRRQRSVLGLLRACRESEAKYLTRTLVQALRVGANWRSVVPALAKAVLMHRDGPKVAKAQLDAVGVSAAAAFHVCPNLERLVAAMLEGSIEDLEARCTLSPGVPIKPMLAKISEGIPDAMRQLKGAPFLAEFKYDGMRAQIHLLQDGQVKIFSRNCEDRSASYPDVAQQIKEAAAGGASSLIVDAELVAVERDATGGEPRIRAFQELSTRARGDVELGSISVAVCVYAFDLIYRDGESLLRRPLRERREALVQALPGMRPGHVALAQSVEVHPAAACGPPAKEGMLRLPEDMAVDWDAREVAGGPGGRVAASPSAAGSDATAVAAGAAQQTGPAAEHSQRAQQEQQRVHEALLEAFAAGTEGLMLKSLTAAYEPSKRSEHWVKLKRDYCEGLHDTLDLVPIGAWHGNGRKVGWFSPFLMAIYDPESEELQSLCRCMSGFSDAFYRETTARLKEHIIPGPKPYYRTDEVPDVWFEAREVWEIRGADLTISPVHKAAVGRLHPDRGVGLRFPRFVRIRDDKALEDASSADVVEQLYRAQTRKVEEAGRKLAKAKTPEEANAAVLADGGRENGEEGAAVREDEAEEQAGGVQAGNGGSDGDVYRGG